jgi:hypothetical protein
MATTTRSVPIGRVLTVGFAASLLFVAACDDGDDQAGPAATVAAPATSSVAPAADGSDLVEGLALEALDVGLGRYNVGSDGEHLWVSGDGSVIWVDPADGSTREITLGDEVVGRVIGTATPSGVWFSEVGGDSVVRIDGTAAEAQPAIEVPEPAGRVVGDAAGSTWIEVSEPPAALRPIEISSGVVGSPLALEGAGEMVGATVMGDRIWVPRFESNEILAVDPTTGEVDDQVATGVGPADVRSVDGSLWFVNRFDGTLGRYSPGTGEVTTITLDDEGPALEAVAPVVSAAGSLWTTAATIDGGVPLVLRLSADDGHVVARRVVPGGPSHFIGGLAAVGDRVFLHDQTAGALVELDLADFTETVDPDRAAPTSDEAPEETAARAAVTELFRSDNAPDVVIGLIEDGDTVADAVTEFRQFFADGFPGEPVTGEVIGLRLDADGPGAEVLYTVNVSDQPIVEPITGRLVRTDGAWLLERESFCALVALGGIACAA